MYGTRKKTKDFSLRPRLLLLLVVGGLSMLTLSFSVQQKTKPLGISILHSVGKSLLALDSAEYTNELGQNFRITKLKYYLSNFCFKSKNGKEFKIDGTCLINEEDPASKELSFNIPVGEDYNSLEFIIGVDSLHNCSGAQSGALDPINAMFWTWNSGYIFLKLEGTSPSSTSPGHVFEYHIGGYTHPHNSIRKVSLPLSTDISHSPAHLTLRADLLELLKTPTQIDFSTLSSVTDSKNAGLVADNYKDMFSISAN